MANPWAVEEEALLRDCWARGLSASQVVAELGSRHSRNAVLGKVFRLGLSKPITKLWTNADEATLRDMWSGGSSSAEIERTLEGRHSSKAILGKIERMGLHRSIIKKIKRLFRREPPPRPKIEPIPEPENGVSILDLKSHHCRYVLIRKKHGLATFCGQTIIHARSSFCPGHHRIVYQR